MSGLGLEGRVVLVTGGGGGIGAATARGFAAAGAKVAVADRDEAAARAVADELAAAGSAATALAWDVTETGAAERALDALTGALGPVTVLAHTAGILRTGALLDTTDADWDALLAVNATGTFRTVRAVATRMVAAGASGSIVCVTSDAATAPRLEMGAYGASKAAATMLLRNLGLELSAYGIRCNVVAPGATDTAMQRDFQARMGATPASAVAGDAARFRSRIPLGRIADPSDVADAVVFLASERARHLTMQTLYVDGGASL